MKTFRQFTWCLLLCYPYLASAHTGIEMTPSFWHGFIHPLSGLDHIATMLAVGIWAGQLRRHYLWLLPLLFLVIMMLAALFGMAGWQGPFTEWGIMLSGIALLLVIVSAVRLPSWVMFAVIASAAWFHGVSHGMEMPANADGVEYISGFASATALLHGLGVLLGYRLGRIWQWRLFTPF